MYSVCNDLKGRVSPFGNLRIKVCLLTPRSLSQATTSFIACNRQGIHHVHLFACPYNVSPCFYTGSVTVQGVQRVACLLILTTTLSVCFRTRLKKLYFFQIVKEQNNSDLEKIKPKSHQDLADLHLNFNGGG